MIQKQTIPKRIETNGRERSSDPHRRNPEEKLNRRVKNRKQFAERVEDYVMFTEGVAEEEEWVEERKKKAEHLAVLLQCAISELDALAHTKIRKRKSAFSFLRLRQSGRIHGLRKKLLRLSLLLENYLHGVHCHPAFRDEVAQIAPLSIPEELFTDSDRGTLDEKFRILRALSDVQRIHFQIQRLQRLLSYYLAQKRATDQQRALGKKMDAVVEQATQLTHRTFSN